MNTRDSEILAGMLHDLEYEPTENEKGADIIILNTCCVRETAENKVWGKIGDLKRLKQANPNLLIGICGCMSQQEEVAKAIAIKAPHIDMVFGTHNIHQLPDLIAKAKECKETIVEVWESEGEIVERLPIRREAGIRAWVTIMYGCNNFCTYCIVPHVRGRERSREAKDIIEEIVTLANEGYKEVTLLGQNVNSYGKDFKEKIDFADLLVELNSINGIERIRFTTSHPRDFNEKLIKVIAECDKLCEHIHLPVQAGSNNILKSMNRGYTREYYLDLVDKIRKSIPNASLSTDLIVGFPGESDDDFKQTLDLIEKVRYDAAYTFVYNKRSGTPAAEMSGQVSEETKKARIQDLINLQNKITLEQNKKDLDKEFLVIVEGISKTNSEKVFGRTTTNKIINFIGTEELIGKTVLVKVIEAKIWSLDGKLIKIV